METIATLEEETVAQLQDLIRVNIDSARGFEAAGHQVRNADLASMFRHHAAIRRNLAADLKRHVELNDDEAELTGTLKGRLHRWWIDLRGKIQNGDEYAILAEAERSDDAIKACYEDAVVETAGSPVSDLLHEHLRSIKETHDRIRGLRDAWASRS